MKRLILLITSLTLAVVRPAAAAIVQHVTASEARGLSGNGVSILLRNGSGTNIDFTETGELIQRAWLDDPSFATFDADVALCQQGRECSQNTGASVIHLRRIVGINFPNLPDSATTLLTIVTNSSGGKKTYLFPIAYGAGAASYVIAPDNQSLSGDGVVLDDGRSANWHDVERGLQLAVEQNLISPQSPVVIRTNRFLSAVRSGSHIEQAIRSSGISMDIVSRLAQMGYRQIPSRQTLPPVQSVEE